jgi:lysyl-tRNA synthetase class 1
MKTKKGVKGKKHKPDKSKFWADYIAMEVKKRVQQNSRLKDIVKKHGYLVYDEKTPSGKIHVGSGRGWIIHDAIAKAMRDNGMKGFFVLSSDDIDPLDKAVGLPKGFEKYLGIPFRDIPSPVKGYRSYADYFFKQSTEKFEEFGIEAKLESTGEQYDKGVFNNAIKIALNKANVIQEIYQRVYGKSVGAGKLPFNPICEKCGRIGTTLAYEWDPEKGVVKYKCSPDLVTWVKGCGHEGEISPYNGNGKLPWKVEWAAKWISKGVVCELAGKDHFTVGGSRTVSIAISDQVYDFPPPYPSTRTEMGKGYEFFNVGGRKMSTSRGEGIGFVDITQFAPAKMIRYMLVRTRPKAALDFDPTRENDVILLYDKYDHTERVFYEKEKTAERDRQNQKRIYELSHVGKLGKQMPPQIPFTYAAMIAQVSKDEKEALDMLQATGHIPKKAGKESIDAVKERLAYARIWAKDYATDRYKIELNDSISSDIKAKLSNGQKSALKTFEKGLTKARTEDDIKNLCFSAAESAGIKPQEFFTAAYLTLLGKERGPRLAQFVLAVGKGKIVKLLKRI